MKAIVYLWGRSIRNYIKQAAKKPGPLIIYIVLIGLVLFSVVAGSNADVPKVERNVTGYAAVLIGAFLFIAYISILNGLKKGTALFSMADVNLLFTAPVAPEKILMGGIAKQAGIMLMASIVMLAQYPNMRNSAGLDGMALIGLVVSYALFGILVNVLSAGLYAYCAGAPNRRKWVNNVLLGLVAVIVGIFVYFITREGDMQAALLRVFGSNAWNYVPFVGWARGLAVAFAEYDYLLMLIFFVLMLVGIFLCIRLIRHANMDFFEDVLVAAENANQAKEDAKAGRMPVQTGTSVGKRLKRDMGGMRGRGATAFLHKILREQKRTGFWLLDASTLATVAGPLFSLIFFPAELRAEIGLWPVFGMTAWMLMFMNLRLGTARELTYPYLYLAPAGGLGKLVCILLPQVIKAAVDGVVYAAFIMLLLQASATEGIMAWLFYTSISALYAAAMPLVERILGSSRNKVLTVVVYIFMLLILFLPGLIGAIIFSGTLGSPYLAYLLCAAWNVGVSLLMVLAGKGILKGMELSN